jgi:hypothetical protein
MENPQYPYPAVLIVRKVILVRTRVYFPSTGPMVLIGGVPHVSESPELMGSKRKRSPRADSFLTVRLVSLMTLERARRTENSGLSPARQFQINGQTVQPNNLASVTNQKLLKQPAILKVSVVTLNIENPSPPAALRTSQTRANLHQ